MDLDKRIWKSLVREVTVSTQQVALYVAQSYVLPTLIFLLLSLISLGIWYSIISLKEESGIFSAFPQANFL